MTHADPTEQYDRDLEPELPKSDPWSPNDDFPHGHPELDDYEDPRDDGKLTPTEAAQMGLIGPDNPDEDDHQSKLDELNTSVHAALDDTVTDAEVKAAFAGGEPEPNMWGDHPKVTTSPTPEPNDPNFGAAAKFLFGDSEEDIAQAREAKRAAQQEKLRVLGQTALDAIYAEHELNTDPRFVEISKLVRKDPNGMSDAEIGETFLSMKQMAATDRAEFIIKLLTVPAERERAVRAYGEYRSMLETL